MMLKLRVKKSVPIRSLLQKRGEHTYSWGRNLLQKRGEHTYSWGRSLLQKQGDHTYSWGRSLLQKRGEHTYSWGRSLLQKRGEHTYTWCRSLLQKRGEHTYSWGRSLLQKRGEHTNICWWRRLENTVVEVIEQYYDEATWWRAYTADRWFLVMRGWDRELQAAAVGSICHTTMYMKSHTWNSNMSPSIHNSNIHELKIAHCTAWIHKLKIASCTAWIHELKIANCTA